MSTPAPQTPPPPAPPQTTGPATDGGTRGRAVRGAAYTTIAQFFQMFVRLAGNVVLARLLTPVEFGIMQLVGVVTQALYMLSDLGTGTAVIQHQRGSDLTFIRTAWTIQIIRGLAISLIGVAISYPLALFYANADASVNVLFPVFAVSTASMIINGCISISIYTKARDLAFGRLILLDAGTQVVGTIANIVAAYYLRNVWALVIGNVITALMRTFLSYTILPQVPLRLCWDRTARQELMHFGKWVFVSTLLTFAAMQADRLILGHFFTSGLLGLWGIAFMLASVPSDILTRIGAGVLMPVYSKTRKDGLVPQRIFAEVAFVSLTVGGWMLAGVLAAGPAFFRTLYTPVYHDAALLLPVVCAAAWVRMLQANGPNALVAMGKLKGVAALNLAKVIAMIVCMPLGYELFHEPDRPIRGLIGVLAGVVVAELARYVVATHQVMKHGLRPLGQDLRSTLLTACLAGLGLLAAWQLRRWGVPAWVELLGSACAVTLLFAFPLWRAWGMIRPYVRVPGRAAPAGAAPRG